MCAKPLTAIDERILGITELRKEFADARKRLILKKNAKIVLK